MLDDVRTHNLHPESSRFASLVLDLREAADWSSFSLLMEGDRRLGPAQRLPRPDLEMRIWKDGTDYRQP